MKVVARFAPFQRTTEDDTKLAPVTVNVNWPPPAIADVGDIDGSDGTGLSIVKVAAADVPPPGVGENTVT